MLIICLSEGMATHDNVRKILGMFLLGEDASNVFNRVLDKVQEMTKIVNKRKRQ
jgi:hypothetical protein